MLQYYNITALAVPCNLAVGELEPCEGGGSACGSRSYQSGYACDVTQLEWAVTGDYGGVYSREAQGVQVDPAKSKSSQ